MDNLMDRLAQIEVEEAYDDSKLDEIEYEEYDEYEPIDCLSCGMCNMF